MFSSYRIEYSTINDHLKLLNYYEFLKKDKKKNIFQKDIFEKMFL